MPDIVLDGGFVGNGFVHIVKTAGLVSFAGVLIVQNLVFASKPAVSVFLDAVLQSAVATFGNLPLKVEFEIPKHTSVIQVSATFLAVERAVFHHPTVMWLAICPGPAVGSQSIKQYDRNTRLARFGRLPKNRASADTGRNGNQDPCRDTSSYHGVFLSMKPKRVLKQWWSAQLPANHGPLARVHHPVRILHGKRGAPVRRVALHGFR